MSGADSASSVAGEFAPSSRVEAESPASLAPSLGSVVDGEVDVALRTPPTADTMITANTIIVPATLEAPVSGNRKLTAWVWKFVNRFAARASTTRMLCAAW